MKVNKQQVESYLASLGIEELNELQQAALDKYEPDQDMLLLAPTGTGKTLGFFLPVLQHVDSQASLVQALILVPSRELAMQIEGVFKSMSTGLKVNCCYGGHSMKTEINNLLHAPAVLIGTPGRIADHLEKNNFDTGGIKTIILDEFDKSLEFGFEEDMKFIISKLPNLRNRILTSATNMRDVPSFVGLVNPVKLNFLQNASASKLEYYVLKTTPAEKLEALLRLICTIGGEPMLVFCNHRDAVDRISELLFESGIVHETFHGGLEQDERERALLKFRNGSHNLLVTTDLASRGLDIPGIRHIIHYQLPPKEDAFIHRNGRTARMKAGGAAYLIITEKDNEPAYLPEEIKEVEIDENAPLPPQPDWETVYISGGKKDKVNKFDIVGLFLQKGGIEKDALGLIEVKDNFSYAAVSRKHVDSVITKINNQKIKKKKVRVERAI